MLMLLGISPEMATAATEWATVQQYYYAAFALFPADSDLLSALAKHFRATVATMLPYSLALMIAGLAMSIGWVILDLPLGPGASVFMDSATE